LVNKNKNLAKECAIKRPLLKVALKKDVKELERLLHSEELLERERDKKYWQVLKKELELLRHRCQVHIHRAP
jgi:hypothetical protein